MTIRRVGIVAKHNLVAASEHLARLGPWLRARGVEAVYEIETAALKQAIEATKSVDPKTIAEYMRSGAVFHTVVGDISFDKKGDPYLRLYFSTKGGITEESIKNYIDLYEWRLGEFVKFLQNPASAQ